MIMINLGLPMVQTDRASFGCDYPLGHSPSSWPTCSGTFGACRAGDAAALRLKSKDLLL